MEKILIEVEGTIHTFESIKEAANYRTDFLKRMESSLGNSPNERLYIDNLIRNKFLSNPKEFYDSRMKGCPVVEIENLLMDLCAAGTADYTGGEGVRANLLKGRSSAKPEAHESLAHG